MPRSSLPLPQSSLKVEDIFASPNLTEEPNEQLNQPEVNFDSEELLEIHKTIANNVATMTDLTMEDLEKLLIEQQKKIKLLEDMLSAQDINLENFKDDEKTNFFFGLSTFKTMKYLFEVLEPYLPESKNKLTKFNVFYLVLTRLRLNLSFKYLAYKFSVAVSTISKYFYDGLFVIYSKLRSLVYWPTRDNIKKTMPETFKRKFGTNVVIIIDCFEIFIEIPSTLVAKAQTWSYYKHSNTVKILIGITPQGLFKLILQKLGIKIILFQE